MTRYLILFLSAGVLAFVLGMGVIWWDKSPAGPVNQEPKTGDSESEGSKRPDPGFPPQRTPNYADMLTAAGWDHEAAQAVVELNAAWFEIQAEENPNGLWRQLKLLENLGRYPTVHRFITEHPEIASLLAASDSPEQLTAVLRGSVDDYPLLAGLYGSHPSPQDAGEVTAALERNRDQIVALLRRGLIGCEVLFLFDREEHSSAIYESWLHDEIQARLYGPDVELASFVNLVMRHGRSIRRRLRDSQTFRLHFRDELWPRLRRVAASNHGMFELYLNEDRIWDLLALDNGEELLRSCGLLPIDLLYGYPDDGRQAYPQSLHDKIIQILLRRDGLAIQALLEFRDEPLFHQLLARSLSSDTTSAVLNELFNSGPNYPEKLARYSRLSNTALADEVGPPASGIITWVPFYYTVYEVPKKILQGREPSGMDLYSATVDPIFLVVDVASGGGTIAGRKALLVGGKKATDRASRELAEKGGGKFLTTTLRDTGLQLARKNVGKELVEKMSEQELANWTFTGLISEMLQTVRSVLGRSTTFEITKPVQFMFQHSGLGREMVKQTTGLEARLFMRGDARVYVRLTNLMGAVVGSRTAAFFERTAQDLSMGTVVESQLGQDVIRGGSKHVLSAREELRAWQQNVSAWWLLNASQDVPGAEVSGD